MFIQDEDASIDVVADLGFGRETDINKMNQMGSKKNHLENILDLLVSKEISLSTIDI